MDAEGTAVSRDQILDTVWGNTYPTDSVVSRAIADLRAALGEAAGDQAYIRTVPKFGYQLLATAGDMPPAVKAAPWVYAVLPVFLLLILWWSWPAKESSDEAVTLRLPPATPLTADSGLEHQPRIVSGTDWVVYAALRPERGDWDLFRVSAEDGATQAIAATAGVSEHGPAVSPDGAQIAYVRISTEGCDVVRQSINFGVPETLAPCTTKFPTLVDWSPKGDHVAYTVLEADDPQGRRRLYQLQLDSGQKVQLSDAVSPTGSDFYPRYSPSGGHVAFLRGEPQPDHRSSLWVVDVANGEETRLTEQPTQLGGMTWLDDQTLLYTSKDAGRLETWTVKRFGTGARKIDGPDLAHPEFSADRQRMVAAMLRSERDLALLDANGAVAAVASSTSDDHHGVLQPQGGFVAYISRRSGFDEIWLFDIAAGKARQLTQFEGATVRYPAWHPDGLQLLFTVHGDAGERIYEIDVLSGAVQALGDENVEATTPVWMPDARGWVFACNSGGEWGICTANELTERKIADGYFRPTPIDNDWLAVVDGAGSLHRMRFEDGHTELLRRDMTGAGRYGWTIHDELLFYIDPVAGGTEARVVRHDLGSGEETVLLVGQMPLADTTLSFNSATQQLLITRYQAASDDLVIFDLRDLELSF